MKELKITFLDWETTDKNPNTAEPLTLFMRTRSLNDFRIIDEHYFTFKPENYLYESFEIHKISYDESMLFDDKWNSFYSSLNYVNKHKDGFFCCHANHLVFGTYGYFDEQIFRQMASNRTNKTYSWWLQLNLKWLSTHTIAKNYLSLKNYSLDNVCEFLGVKFKHHDCMEDVKATEEIFKNLIPSNITEEELMEVGNYKNIVKGKKEINNGTLKLI